MGGRAVVLSTAAALVKCDSFVSNESLLSTETKCWKCKNKGMIVCGVTILKVLINYIEITQYFLVHIRI